MAKAPATHDGEKSHNFGQSGAHRGCGGARYLEEATMKTWEMVATVYGDAATKGAA